MHTHTSMRSASVLCAIAVAGFAVGALVATWPLIQVIRAVLENGR